PSQPRSDTRTSYQVGRPWMLDGKMLRGLTGTPIRRMALANSSLAEAEPEPLTLANLTTKSLVDCSGVAAGVMRGLSTDTGARPLLPSSFPRKRESSGFPSVGCPRKKPSRWVPAFAGMATQGRSRLLRNSRRLPRAPVPTPRPRMRLQQQELLHVPSAGRAAFGAQAAVQADIFVLDHHAQRLQRPGHVQVLLHVQRRRG